MNSLYIHIPFCNYKCDYCNFFVLQKNHPHFQDNLISKYTVALHHEIDHWSSTLGNQDIKTIYFGGWTPLLLGKENVIWIIDHIQSLWGLQYLEEITIELNPDPFTETLQFIKEMSTRYASLPRIRFSVGIQTFDDDILTLSGRNYSYNALKWYLRNLQTIKQSNTCYNFDFIAFGTLDRKSKQGGYGWNDNKVQFLEGFVNSHMADSFSLYMLELFPGSRRHSQTESTTQTIHDSKLKQCISPDDNKVMEEYSILSSIVSSAWYHRYEVSNYALPGKNSIHNSVYWTMQPYLGIGASASGMIIQPAKKHHDNWHWDSIQSTKIRYTNTSHIMEYINGMFTNPQNYSPLQEYDVLYETLMLGLRSYGVKQISDYQSILVTNYQDKLNILEKEGLLIQQENSIKLTDDGYNVANRILSELLK